MRILSTLVVLLLAGCAHGPHPDSFPLNPRFDGRSPGRADIDWFYRAKGKSEAAVLKEYGTPVKTEARSDGIVVWHYPWYAAATLSLKNSVVISAYYTAGY